MASTVKTKNKYWNKWVPYAQALGVDPYLPDDESIYHHQIRALAGFAGRVKTGYYGYSREVQSGTVSSAFSAIGEEISMVRRYNPLKMNGSDKLLQPLKIMMAGCRKWDKPTEKKHPVGVDVVELLCAMGQLGMSALKDAVLGDWVLIAFYYLLRVGEYTEKSTRQNSKQTQEFRLKDVIFFEKGDNGNIRQMPRDVSAERVLNAVGATLRLSNQKNGWKNVCIFHFSNGDAINCPVRALARRFLHVKQHAKNENEKLSAYWVKGKRFALKDRQVGAALKAATVKLGYPARGIPKESIDTHSLRAGGANALHLNGFSDREIQKMGRWRGETFKEYIREHLSVFSEGMSRAMKKDFQFVNVHAGIDSDVVDVTVDSINTPYQLNKSVAKAA